MAHPMEIDTQVGGSNAIAHAISLDCAVEYEEVDRSKPVDMLAMASLKAAQVSVQDDARAPMDIVMCLDRSGSMCSDGKMPLMKQTVHIVMDQCGADDRVAIVSFDDRIEVLLPFTSMNEAGRALGRERMKRLDPPWLDEHRGRLDAELGAVYRPECQPRANCAARTPERMVDAMNELRMRLREREVQAARGKVEPGWTANTNLPQLPAVINTFGLGTNHDADMLRGIAENAAGVFYFISDADQITSAFADCLGGLLSVVAQEVEVKFTGLNGSRISRVMTRFASTAVEGSGGGSGSGASHSISVGTVQAGEHRDLIVQLQLPALPAVQPNPMLVDGDGHGDGHDDRIPILRIDVTYVPVTGEDGDQGSQSVVAYVRRPAPDALSRTAETSYSINTHRNRIRAAEALDKAAELGKMGDLDKAVRTLLKAIDEIQKSISAGDDLCRSLVRDLERSRHLLSDHTMFRRAGHSTMSTLASSHHQQRSVSYGSFSYNGVGQIGGPTSTGAAGEPPMSPYITPSRHDIIDRSSKSPWSE